MNAYRFNSVAQYHLRKCISKELQIDYSDVYRVVKDIDYEGLITTKDGKKYKLGLRRVS